MKYNLISTKTRMVIEGIVIDEFAKEDFKEMMDWDEMQWRHNTSIITENKSKDL